MAVRKLIRVAGNSSTIRPLLVFLNVKDSPCIGEVVDLYGFPLFQARQDTTFSGEVLIEIADLLSELSQ